MLVCFARLVQHLILEISELCRFAFLHWEHLTFEICELCRCAFLHWQHLWFLTLWQHQIFEIWELCRFAMLLLRFGFLHWQHLLATSDCSNFRIMSVCFAPLASVRHSLHHLPPRLLHQGPSLRLPLSALFLSFRIFWYRFGTPLSTKYNHMPCPGASPRPPHLWLDAAPQAITNILYYNYLGGKRRPTLVVAAPAPRYPAAARNSSTFLCVKHSCFLRLKSMRLQLSANMSPTTFGSLLATLPKHSEDTLVFK